MNNAILIVEDHDSVRNLLSDWLCSVFPEFEIIGTKTGEEALIVIKKILPEIVIMDINLPGINGIEATKLIKHLYPQTKVTILSMYEDEVYRNDAIFAGASIFIPKRLMHTDLIPAIKLLLSTNSGI
ncbi:MAG: response regulator transcription factor [Syntrophorhabdaceae bacterium]|nr:response regulator transcription factor [Syntrophorhabdaceae bacterium]